MALARGVNVGFTDKYDVDRLLYWECFDEVSKAINREKQLKGWRRSKKIALIEFAIRTGWIWHATGIHG
jgi:predicted GIY-YIG superfamily endonuclease